MHTLYQTNNKVDDDDNNCALGPETNYQKSSGDELNKSDDFFLGR